MIHVEPDVLQLYAIPANQRHSRLYACLIRQLSLGLLGRDAIDQVFNQASNALVRLKVLEFDVVLHNYSLARLKSQAWCQSLKKRLGERLSRLRTRGMVVLAVDRAGKITPALHAKTILLPGDRLICYGKIESIKSIADERTSDIAEDDSQVNLQV